MLKELIISFEMFDEFEGLLADDIEDMEDLSIYLLILPTPSRAFLAGTARQGYEKE